ncbi:MAG: LysM peptidoglycan-binding domain-containing protein, partial [Chloroflexi bacterium]|nr:LysM peptidoglycan-binding domain-containing protein [Chloroflexota bacterium]
NTPPAPPDPNNPSDNPPGSTWGFNRPDIPSHCLHIVTQNQTLFRIALAHNFSVREISSLNGLVSDDRLLVGQALIIPYEDCVQYAPLKG